MKILIFVGLLCCVLSRCKGAELTATTRNPVTITTTVDTTSAETTENTTFISSTTEFSSTSRPTTEELIAKLLTTYTVELNESNKLMGKVEDDTNLLLAGSIQQIKDLQQLESLKHQFVNSSLLMNNLSLNYLKALSNTMYKVELNKRSTNYAVENVVREQQKTKNKIFQLQNKLQYYQKSIVNSSQHIDNSIEQLITLISRAVLPKINNLRSQFSSLNISHININAELQNISTTANLNESSIKKLNELNQQLSYLNRTKNTQLRKVSETFQILAPENLTILEKSLQNLIIQGKRIDLGLSICSSKKAKNFLQDSSRKDKTDTKYISEYLKNKRSLKPNQKLQLRVQKQNDAPNRNIPIFDDQYQTTSAKHTNLKADTTYLYKNAYKQPDQLKTNAASEDSDQVYEILQPEPKVFSTKTNKKTKKSQTIEQQPIYDTKEVSYSMPEIIEYHVNDKAHTLFEPLEEKSSITLKSEVASSLIEPDEVNDLKELQSVQIVNFPYTDDNNKEKTTFTKSIDSYQAYDNNKQQVGLTDHMYSYNNDKEENYNYYDNDYA